MASLFCDRTILKLKICGLVSKDDIVTCCELGVDAVGFLVKHAKPLTDTDILVEEEAKELISLVPDTVKSVLLVKFSDIYHIIRLIENTNPDVIQLQKETTGIELPKKLKSLFPSIEIIKTFYVDPTSTTEQLLCEIKEYIPYIDAINLDSATGGSGKKHDWSNSAIISEYAKTKGIAFVLAGGINASNIEEAYRQVKPDMIDVMSGARLKNSLAKKDSIKIGLIMNIVNKINSHET